MDKKMWLLLLKKNACYGLFCECSCVHVYCMVVCNNTWIGEQVYGMLFGSIQTFFSSIVFHHFNFIFAQEKKSTQCGHFYKINKEINTNIFLHKPPVDGFCCIPLSNVPITCLCADSGMCKLDQTKTKKKTNKQKDTDEAKPNKLKRYSTAQLVAKTLYDPLA